MMCHMSHTWDISIETIRSAISAEWTGQCCKGYKILDTNCQAKVKSSQEKVKEKSPKKERLDFADCMVISPPPTHPPQ